ncbi:hypothetical protein NBRC3280_1266 [Acetobacter pasteurianus NBRC 3280]|uniref:Uncharacterized protein n=1 Tax=Acetobacter pasteurianus NBRC 3278 TaxID=1226660 RepID=A0A401X3A6_ACEPA|nr:hypothetical protein NBRC106471_1316 [Acetobacter pasteurianus subsp. pasteurianus LMG 1262 = NBRC 106471]GCD58764.1 hypothetical protein NBRC3277_1339 [Acetobacter pasteurianus NBRC 3277]GCD62258.1 hypothetical protein NBRC3278_1351 [Acetobacter pasteurianus NBRC 3278]GCD68631.1 hypothetical protein NBRC3280_1266 [Acetobacter pasteurianus NBRC 3280]
MLHLPEYVGLCYFEHSQNSRLTNCLTYETVGNIFYKLA